MSAGWLVVGAGFTGAIVAERLASAGGMPVLVIDQRDYIGGNAAEARSDEGIRYHRHGPHIFHTNSAEVAAYLSRFTAWRPYEHRVLGDIGGTLVPVPFNLTALERLFPPHEARRLTTRLVETYGMGSRIPILKLRRAEDAALRALADFIYANVFAGYTRKQWGLAPEALAPSVTARVPIVVSHDDRYFDDSFQMMPRAGYAALFEAILAHPNIRVALGTRYEDVAGERFDGIVHTGAIDAFFGAALGPLPYRSIRFDLAVHPGRLRQPVATINHPNGPAFTRTTEMGHLTGEWSGQTLVATEYPGAHRPGETEPHYPVPREENRALYARYRALAEREVPHVIFAGRLGDYSYYNMDQAAARALSLARRIIAG
jgi:UDP-galactopyranose mutase